jgi:hypothetical protein
MMSGKMENEITNKEEPEDDKEQRVIDYDDLTRIIIRHEDEIRHVVKNVNVIADFIKKIPKNKVSAFFRYVSDKEYVIVGVVVMAICAMFLIPDPTNIIMSITSGLFGIGTGRMMGNGKDEE